MLKFLKQDDYLKIIEIGLINIRDLANNGDSQACFDEADHLHNIPEFLQTLNEGAEEYYWSVEREIYLVKGKRERIAAYEKIWSRKLDKNQKGNH